MGGAGNIAGCGGMFCIQCGEDLRVWHTSLSAALETCDAHSSMYYQKGSLSPLDAVRHF